MSGPHTCCLWCDSFLATAQTFSGSIRPTLGFCEPLAPIPTAIEFRLAVILVPGLARRWFTLLPSRLSALLLREQVNFHSINQVCRYKHFRPLGPISTLKHHIAVWPDRHSSRRRESGMLDETRSVGDAVNHWACKQFGFGLNTKL